MLLHEKQAVYWSLAYPEVKETWAEARLTLEDFILGPFDRECLSEFPPESDWSDWFPPPPRRSDWELDELSDWVELEAAKHDLIPDPDTYPFEDYFLIRRPMKPKMTPINIPVPPEPILEQAVGYKNDVGARYLSLWWECAVDEAMLSDGSLTTTTTANWAGYLAYIHHKAVHPHLASYNLGSSDDPARYHLMIDLFERKAYIALCRVAEKVLEEIWWLEAAEIEKMTLSDEDAKALIMAFEEALQETPEDDELPPSMEEERQAVLELTQWLDKQLK